MKKLLSLVFAFMLALSQVSIVSAANLQWPVPGHTAQSRGFSSSHAGIDITDSSITGAKVYAALGGTVYKKYTCGTQHYGSLHTCDGFGTGLIIKGTDGKYYQYAHMQANSIPSSITQGSTVKQGQQVGKVGTTGNSTGVHFHFQIGTAAYSGAVNPMNYSYTYTTPGSKPVDTEANHNPKGYLDYITTPGTGKLRVQGWAIEPDAPKSPVTVHVYIYKDGKPHFVDSIVANGYRSDIAKAYPTYGGNHGFDKTINVAYDGNVTVQVYCINTGRGTTNPACVVTKKTTNKLYIKPDTTKPVISNVKVSNLTENGYTVSVTATDNVVVDRVQFPTWTTKNGQDDIQSSWTTNKKASGTKNGNTYTYTVKRSDHKNEYGTYVTHIYAYDKKGNVTKATVNYINLKKTVPITSVKLNKTKVTVKKKKSTTLKATINPSNTTYSKALKWKSSNTKIATVNSSGKVTAKKKKGKCTITVTTSNGKTAKCTVTVK